MQLVTTKFNWCHCVLLQMKSIAFITITPRHCYVTFNSVVNSVFESFNGQLEFV